MGCDPRAAAKEQPGAWAERAERVSHYYDERRITAETLKPLRVKVSTPTLDYSRRPRVRHRNMQKRDVLEGCKTTENHYSALSCGQTKLRDKNRALFLKVYFPNI